MLNKLLLGSVVILLKLWMKSWRIRMVRGKEPLNKVLITLWHEHLPICMRAFKNQGYCVLISQSKDGDIAAKICQDWGYQVFRGSSSKGAVGGLKSLLDFYKQNPQSPGIGMALDGPRGPYHHINSSTNWLCQQLELTALFPKIKVKYFFRLKNWDRTLIPLPFSTIYIELTQFISVKQEVSTARLDMDGDYVFGLSSSKVGAASKS